MEQKQGVLILRTSYCTLAPDQAEEKDGPRSPKDPAGDPARQLLEPHGSVGERAEGACVHSDKGLV